MKIKNKMGCEMMKKFLKIIILSFIIVFILFSIWSLNPLGPMKEAKEILNSNNEGIQIENTSNIVFKPQKYETGLIFYPGGRVDPKSYSIFAEKLAEEDILVIIAKMPFNLAIFNSNKADKIIQDYPEVKNWYISGHSLGGAMAAKYVYENPDKIKNLILYAAYPAENNDLSNSNINVLSIYAENDGLANQEKIKNNKQYLPDSTKYVEIIGGNHAQFGYYGEQEGDNPSQISREEQTKIIIQNTLNFIKK
jgi:dienelactone hydrolase